ncbi:unnamed protein product [Penicillium manginii]
MGGFAVKFDETTAAAPLQDSDSDSEVLVVENDDSDANDPAGMYYSHLNQRLQSQVELVDWQATHSPREDSASPVQDKLRLSSFPRLSRWIGPIWWKEDETNSSSMDQAFRECLDINDYNYDKYCENLEQLQADIWVLDAKQLLQAWEYGIIDKLPAVTEDDISDKNKSDFVVKILAVGQIVWFVIQLGDRLYSKLPISLLEILTFSFAINQRTLKAQLSYALRATPVLGKSRKLQNLAHSVPRSPENHHGFQTSAFMSKGHHP